ncbi:MAG: gamma-glutamylcyclotransferase family protein [Pseudomonadota bacterium]
MPKLRSNRSDLEAMKPTHLFFYGTLREGVGDWPFLTGLGLGAEATTQGALYAIPHKGGWRAALFPTQARFAANVVGTLHEAGEVDLAAIDAFANGAFATGAFVRQLVEVDGWSGAGDMADTYIWSGDLPDGAEPIAHGDFARWLEETGRRPA